jgi:cell fate (sporulation/competence/biofilm development) regulator YlbF (YheA/YmcA/DUF963 family)
MQLIEEIKDAARQLGQALHQDDHLRPYLDALQEIQTDPEASALEKKMYEVYEELICRQQGGEDLCQEDTRGFHELRRQEQNHPLISKRDDMLRSIRPYLNQVAEEISFVLGVDFAALARSQ